LALAGAGYVNSLVMRSEEMTKGIRLYDPQGNEAGRSKIAAIMAVNQTALTRALLAFNMVFLPGFIIGMLHKRWLLPKNTILRSIAELCIISASLLIGLPMTIASYDRVGKIKPSQVEKELRDYKMSDGQ